MRNLYRVGGASAILLGISYLVITVLYAFSGALPDGAEEWVGHISGHITEWWAILGLSVLTDFLFIPVMWALYLSLKDINKNAMLAGAGLVVLFVLLDLAVTWPNYSSLITLSGNYAAAMDDTQRTALAAAANYASGVLSSGLFGVYAILVPSLGILIIGLVMLKGVFGKAMGFLGVATGILGIISVAGPIFIDALGMTAILTSILTTVWVLLAGYKLLRQIK